MLFGDKMKIMCRRHCIRYVFTFMTMCLVVGMYMAAIKHNMDVHKQFHIKRLKVKRDVHVHTRVHEFRQRMTNLKPIKEPPHVDKDKNSFKREDNDSLHVHIVEEHHEVIPYWFAAVRKGILPRSGNTLVHIDGHSDLAPPRFIPGYPTFKMPHEKDLKYLMQSNDVFIQASAMTGLVNRVIWVWPDWDQSNHDSNYFMSTISLGMVMTGQKTKPARKEFCACLKNETRFECRTNANISRQANYSVEDDYFTIPRSMCKIMKILIVEEIHEFKALSFFGKSDWIAESENIILDIDEDFFGCSYAIQPLLKSNLSLSKIVKLDNLIAAHLCPTSFSHEKDSDKYLVDILAVARTKRACIKDNRLKHTDRCNETANVDLLKHFKHKLERLVSNNIVRMCSKYDNAYAFAHSLVTKIATYSIKQIRALQETGFCSHTSTKTFRADQNTPRFGICKGSNTPEDTAVLEHTPTLTELATRSVLLKGLLKKLTDHSVKLVTVSRSVRDGYTPRQFFERIEANVLNGLNESFHGHIDLHYDRELLGGKPGWPARHKA